MIKKILKRIALFIVGSIALIILIGTLFVNLSPEFGGSPTDKQLAEYAKSANSKDGVFVNQQEVKMSMSFGEMVDGAIKYFGAQENTAPAKNIEVLKIDSLNVGNYASEKPRLIWFGHSTVLLQIEGKNILIDPMFGEVAAPHPWLGSPRFSKELPIEIEQLPEIDAVILSHDHYDHLDYGSILRLKNKVKAFYMPLGVGTHLTEWGIDPASITELDWWEETNFQGLTFACTPAQHFSGRGITNRSSTLWSSWVVQSANSAIYFSGDGGYGEHFKQIGAKYGPFDFAMLECGQYNEQWKDIHMFPEQTAQAGVDLQAKLIMPIHWGAFKLAMHSWTDPIERVTKKAKELGIATATPQIGEPIIIADSVAFPTGMWWAARP